MTGGTRPCAAWCRGDRFGVRRDDGGRAWIRTRDVVEADGGGRPAPRERA